MEQRMASEIILKKIDEVFMQVQCDDGLARDLHDFFSFTVPGAKFMPSYKNRYWDGKVRLFSIKTNKKSIVFLKRSEQNWTTLQTRLEKYAKHGISGNHYKFCSGEAKSKDIGDKRKEI